MRSDQIDLSDPTLQARTSSTLVAYWESGELVLQNYYTNRKVTLDPLALKFMGELTEFRPVSQILERLQGVPNAESLISLLIDSTMLTIRDSDQSLVEDRIESTWKWDVDARHFHYSTRNTRFTHEPAEESRKLVELAQKEPPPPCYKTYENDRIDLTNDQTAPVDFWSALSARRTVRNFDRSHIPFETFSQLVASTWGKTSSVDDPNIGEFVLKTTPSGGARHPIEVYPVVMRVEGVDPGVYHYSVEHNALELLGKNFSEKQLVDLCGGQAWVRDAAAVCFMTAVVDRSMWKYRQSHAYRVLLLDAGHLGQTFHLVSTALGLAPFTTAATDDQAIEQFLGLDGVSEIALYTAVAGYPVGD